ncbi:prepilin-type N-terminal cleavage/methylation domain-containing protein [Opitutaceae bacterium TAV1]|nr:prepilin-type N-terminal cleavage/methylation domain-containing protein [Opitutaceae bacterium TAV1]
MSDIALPASREKTVRLSRYIRGGFTLIELLTVIAIIGILAAIIIPTVGKVRESARSTRCVSNLRSVGVAMALHIEDHKGSLPGPLQSGQGTPDANKPGFVTWTAYDPETVSESVGPLLPIRLGPYMSFPASGQPVSADVFLCPQGAVKYPRSPSWVVPGGIDEEKGSTTQSTGVKITHPFGYPNGTTTKNIRIIHGMGIPPSRLWAVMDTNATAPGGFAAGANSWQGISPTPSHGSYSNALFFDWRVGKIDAAGNIR